MDLTSAVEILVLVGIGLGFAYLYYEGEFATIKPRFLASKRDKPYVSIMYDGRPIAKAKLEVEIGKEIFPVKRWEVRKSETDNPINTIDYYAGDYIEPITFNEDEYEWRKVTQSKKGLLYRVRVLDKFGITIDRERINELEDIIERKQDKIDDLQHKLEEISENEEVQRLKKKQKKHAEDIPGGMERGQGRYFDRDEDEK